MIERLSGANPAELQYPGTSPDPAVVLTLGLLVTTGRRVPLWLLIVPLLWLVLSGAWTLLLGVPLRLLASHVAVRRFIRRVRLS